MQSMLSAVLLIRSEKHDLHAPFDWDRAGLQRMEGVLMVKSQVTPEFSLSYFASDIAAAAAALGGPA
ncbi:hypothetical protein AWC27_12620 [Mycobacterium szulgai]|uniref:Uncharacterized protein n=2 Tax=Mycobacterium szulgai TaxID=1787 RepID=A0A1X2DNX3_MYCSZ|nr:hypothetical protein [Mycobacterium szulgai]ORW89724.1 hypothetical protein AWC27_12620 [Mycobacterium szulgai]